MTRSLVTPSYWTMTGGGLLYWMDQWKKFPRTWTIKHSPVVHHCLPYRKINRLPDPQSHYVPGRCTTIPQQHKCGTQWRHRIMLWSHNNRNTNRSHVSIWIPPSWICWVGCRNKPSFRRPFRHKACPYRIITYIWSETEAIMCMPFFQRGHLPQITSFLPFVTAPLPTSGIRLYIYIYIYILSTPRFKDVLQNISY